MEKFMKKIVFILLTTVTALTATGQIFEGKIVYNNTYKSKQWLISDEKLNSLMGTKQYFFVKGGDYKSLTNGTFQWTEYINKDNKIYIKILDKETIYWSDALKQEDKILKVELHKDATEILGHKCDEIILTTKAGTSKYYFNSITATDSKLFEKHKLGNWYDYLKMANAWPLKIVVDNDKFSLVSIASEIKEMKLDEKSFALPANSPIKKNPF
jgi:hypothetical protein